MARITDTSKMDKIREAIIDTVVVEGIRNASVAKIAKQAQVSMGYLYRFHSSKQELIDFIFKGLFQNLSQRLLTLLQEEKKLNTALHKFIAELFTQANEHPNRLLFLIKLTTDYSFHLAEQERETLIEICNKTLSLGLQTKEIREDMTPEMLYTIIIGTAFFFINLRERAIFNKSAFTQEDVQLLTDIYTQALA
uniref:TetR/AcrR family transcriptional regulator n=1 Tax=Ornithobacterium rhinotracheale TaxID=28251 RepID=UPI0039A4B536